MKRWLPLSLLVLTAACTQEVDGSGAGEGSDECPPEGCQELGAGDVLGDAKTDGDWSHALTCKPIPDLPPLEDPAIVISLNGLTMRLYDRGGDYEKVFPIGPGAIHNGESRTPTSDFLPEGVFHTRTDMTPRVDNTDPDRAVWAWSYSCRFWGEGLPYFAGLPFVRLEGPSYAVYGFHGPIDKYTIPSGGMLRRGFVSHGCVRMEAADILEVYALLQGHRAPVRVQKSIDRYDDGRAVDIEQKWMLSECDTDADCNYGGGICRPNPSSGRSYCTKACTSTCPDLHGYPITRCVAEPGAEDASTGICMPASDPIANGCRRYDTFAESDVPAFNNASVNRTVCLPGPQRWLGSRCTTHEDCDSGVCGPYAEGESTVGLCTEACDRYCPDTEGAPGTFCVDNTLGVDGAGMCVAQCVLNEDCPLGTACVSASRVGQPDRVSNVCLPQ
jgi:L,D-transpeptidase catalytic domain